MKNKQAKLISPWLTSKPGGRCLKFYYTMYGRTTGSLEVKLHQYGKRPRVLFYKKGDQGPPWHLGTATIDVKGKFQVRRNF